MRPNKDNFPLPSADVSPPLRASIYPESGDGAAALSDDDALRKIGKRTSTTGKVVALLLVVGAAVLVWTYVERSTAYEQRMNTLNAAGGFEAGSPQMLSGLRAELASTTYDDVKVRAIRNLAHFKDKQAVPLLIKELDTAGIVRRAAALALARIGSPDADTAKPKLLQVLPDTDARDRPQVVWALAVLAEAAAADAILDEFVKGLLQGQPGFDPAIITRALGIKRLSSPKLTGHEKMPVRVLVATSLSEAATPDVVDPLVRMINNPKEDPGVIRAAIAGLGRTGDPRAAQPMFELMLKRADMRPTVLEALRKSTAAPGLVVLVQQAKDAGIKRDLVRLLANTHDPRAADALAQLATSEDLDTKVEAAHGLAELGDARAVQPLLELARNEDETIGDDALVALRDLGDPAAGPAIMALYDEFPYRKADILRALGASHYEPAGPILERELEGDDIAAAIKALGELPYPKVYSRFVGMLKRDPNLDFTVPSLATEEAYRNRYEVMRGLRLFGIADPKAVKALMTIVEDPEDDFRLVNAAGECLGQIADKEVLATILQKIQDPSLEERVRVAYVQGLWLTPDREFARQLFPLFQADAPSPIRRAAALAIGYAGDPSNDAQLIQMLGPEQTRRDAAVAIVLSGGEEAPPKLLEVLDQDRDLREVLRMAVTSNVDDNFNLLNEEMFTSGQVYRRLRGAEILKEGTSETASYSYIWTHLTTRLTQGWQGPGGASRRYIRGHLYKSLISEDPALRRLVAETFVSMNERGLLLAARDAGVKEARTVLMQLDRPAAQTKKKDEKK